MRGIIFLLVIIYLVGVGVALAPTVQSKWNTATAAELSSNIAEALPDALAWPVRAFRTITNHN